MIDPYILAVDVGTQSVRAIVFNREGDQIASARKISEPYYSLQPGWAEIPAEQFWDDSCQVIREVVEKLGAGIAQVKAMTITANRDNIIPLDENDQPLRDWLTWIDTRRTPEIIPILRRTLKGADKLIYTVKRSFFDMVAPRSKFNWIRIHEPEVYARAKIYVTLTGFLTHRLCGVFHDSLAMQVGYMPYEAKRQDWYKIPAVYKILGVRRDQLVDIFPPGSKLGEITEEASEKTLLPAGLPLIAAAGDKMCETLGSGVFSPKQATVSYGTMATIGTTITRYVEDSKLKFYTFASCIPDAWNPEYNIYRGYWLITWFCNQYSKEQGMPEFLNEMNELAADVPPGSNGLFVFPFWTVQPGLYPHGKGMVAGWIDRHTVADLYRAFLESIAYALREGLEIMEKKCKTRTEKLYVVGGGSKSDVAMQLTADIFNLPATRLSNTEVCAAGAAINAGIWAGIYKDYEDGVASMMREHKTFYPIPQNVEIYERIYHDIYKKIYLKNKDLFKKLGEFGHFKSE